MKTSPSTGERPFHTIPPRLSARPSRFRAIRSPFETYTTASLSDVRVMQTRISRPYDLAAIPTIRAMYSYPVLHTSPGHCGEYLWVGIEVQRWPEAGAAAFSAKKKVQKPIPMTAIGQRPHEQCDRAASLTQTDLTFRVEVQPSFKGRPEVHGLLARNATRCRPQRLKRLPLGQNWALCCRTGWKR